MRGAALLMRSTAPRCVHAALGAWIALAPGCGEPPAREPSAPESAARLVRCAFELEGCTQYLDTDVPAPADAADASATHAPEPSGSARRGPPRMYEVLARDGRTVEVRDFGGASTGSPLGRLRELSLEALRSSMRPPRRPLDWHFVALAGFLGLEPPLLTVAERTALVRRLAERPDLRPLAAALYEHALDFDQEVVAPLRDRDEVALRLLALVREALAGRREALREILTLSLEYHGELDLFDRAVRAVVRAPGNPELYARHPVSGDRTASILFLREVDGRLRAAEYRPGSGWILGEP